VRRSVASERSGKLIYSSTFWSLLSGGVTGGRTNERDEDGRKFNPEKLRIDRALIDGVSSLLEVVGIGMTNGVSVCMLEADVV
jgi:hypothetical protein